MIVPFKETENPEQGMGKGELQFDTVCVQNKDILLCISLFPLKFNNCFCLI